MLNRKLFNFWTKSNATAQEQQPAAAGPDSGMRLARSPPRTNEQPRPRLSHPGERKSKESRQRRVCLLLRPAEDVTRAAAARRLVGADRRAGVVGGRREHVAPGRPAVVGGAGPGRRLVGGRRLDRNVGGRLGAGTVVVGPGVGVLLVSAVAAKDVGVRVAGDRGHGRHGGGGHHGGGGDGFDRRSRRNFRLGRRDGRGGGGPTTASPAILAVVVAVAAAKAERAGAAGRRNRPDRAAVEVKVLAFLHGRRQNKAVWV